MSEAAGCARGEALQETISLHCFAPLTGSIHCEFHHGSTGNLWLWNRVSPGCLQSA